MSEMYERIAGLCKEAGIKPGRICADTGISRGLMTDLKMGRTKELSAKNTKIIADYLGVSTDYLLGKEKAPTGDGERKVEMDDFTYAMHGASGKLTDRDKEILLSMAQQLVDANTRKATNTHGETDETI